PELAQRPVGLGGGRQQYHCPAVAGVREGRGQHPLAADDRPRDGREPRRVPRRVRKGVSRQLLGPQGLLAVPVDDGAGDLAGLPELPDPVLQSLRVPDVPLVPDELLERTLELAVHRPERRPVGQAVHEGGEGDEQHPERQGVPYRQPPADREPHDPACTVYPTPRTVSMTDCPPGGSRFFRSSQTATSITLGRW